MANINRRRFLSATAASMGFMSGAATLGAMTAGRAYGADTRGYKALVCIFLLGGLDHADAVLPADQATYDQLRSHREGIFSSHGAARARDNLLVLNAENAFEYPGRQLALGQEMSALHNLFENGEAAIVSDVGPLIEPTTRSDMDANRVATPPRLFSHNDQQSTWMALSTEGARYGWGGRFADAVLTSSPSENGQFAAISASSSNSVFLAGEIARQFKATNGGPRSINLLDQDYNLGNNDSGDLAREQLSNFLKGVGYASSNLLSQDIANATARAVDNTDLYRQALSDGLELSTEFPDTSLGRQLSTVAQSISIQQYLNISRQVFYVSRGGFDTHSNQANSITNLLGEVSDAIAAFRNAMVEIGQWNNVTAFTASDFGRTVIGNGGGSDHGWAGHQFVVGGQVNGKRIYFNGQLADYDVDADYYFRTRGRLIPTTSVEQYAGTLGSWFGLDSGELNSALPNLRNFDQSNLGFV